jgi:hypothetical protein
MEHSGRGTLIAVYIRLTHGTRNTGTKIEKVTLMVTENTSKRVPRGILFGKKTRTPPVMGPK